MMAVVVDTHTKRDESTVAPVVYTKTTSETITENFDDLLARIASHLQNEHKEGRILGKEYATAYIQMMQTVLQVASQIETFEAKRASHERQWKLKVVDSLASQHAMISNVLGTLDEANILPILRDSYNDLYESEAFAVWSAQDYEVGERLHYPTVTDPVYVCTTAVAVTTWANSDVITTGDFRRAIADGVIYIATTDGTTSGTDIGDDVGVTWAVADSQRNPTDTTYWRQTLHWS